MTDSGPDVQIGALEDGYRPPADPDEWERVYSVVTGKPCPTCGTAIGVLLGPLDALDETAQTIQSDYDGQLADGWHDGYENPVYTYCDRPACSWHGVVEWADLRPAFEAWIHADAPTWKDQLEAEGEL